jgi:hypothetical protein
VYTAKSNAMPAIQVTIRMRSRLKIDGIGISAAVYDLLRLICLSGTKSILSIQIRPYNISPNGPAR